MSNGKHWRSYIHGSRRTSEIVRYLRGEIDDTVVKILLPDLLEDTDMRRPPTLEWYKLHRIAVGEGKWTADIISWGLNVAKPSFVAMQRDLTHAEAVLSSGKLQKETAEHKQAKHPPVFAPIEVPYGLMKPRFCDAPIPERLWYKSAISEISLRCEIAAMDMLRGGFYDKSDGSITDKGVNLWKKRLDEASEPSIPNSAVATALEKRKRSDGKRVEEPKRRKFLSSVPRNRPLDDIEDEEDEEDATSGRPSKQQNCATSSKKRPLGAAKDKEEEGNTPAHLSKHQSSSSALAASAKNDGSLPLENSQHAQSGTTMADTDFSVMVAFEPPNPSSDDTNAWERYFKQTVLDKQNQHPCLKDYTWTQEKSGWGEFVHTGQRDAHRLGATAALRDLLKIRGFSESKNLLGGPRFDPIRQTPPGHNLRT